jgi:dihydrofolate reductase
MIDLQIVVACSENDVIGRENYLPWHLPDDLRHFKALTLGHPVLMGRKTFDSIGKALPGRQNLILTRAQNFHADRCTPVPSIEAARRAAGDVPVLMVIGGGEVFRACILQVLRIHLTLVHAQVAGDAFFSGWRGPEWRETAREDHAADARHAFAFSFLTLDRR